MELAAKKVSLWARPTMKTSAGEHGPLTVGAHTPGRVGTGLLTPPAAAGTLDCPQIRRLLTTPPLAGPVLFAPYYSQRGL